MSVRDRDRIPAFTLLANAIAHWQRRTPDFNREELTMRKTEVAHHTPEQVHDYIIAAEAIVTKAELHPDLQAIAFSKAIDLLAAKQLFFEQVSPTMAIPRNNG